MTESHDTTATWQGAAEPSADGAGAPLPVSTPPAGRRWSLTWETAAIVLLLAVALAMRLWELDARAMHHDEAIHFNFSQHLRNGAVYLHDPAYHGPLLYHITALSFLLLGATDVAGRLPFVLSGVALVGLPFLLRPELGRVAAWATAVLLAVSPAMLYFSRLGHDFYMMPLALGLVVCFWRYLREERPGYLYGASALLALMFSGKENTYIYVAIFGGIFFLLALPQLWLLVRRRTTLAKLRGPAVLLLLLGTLSLPLWGTLASIPAGWFGWVLARPQTGDVPLNLVGLPATASATIIAGGVVLALFLVSIALGLLWNVRRWLICALIFWAIFAVLYSSFFRAPYGLFTGIWQGLGYWLAQHEFQRGNQPWYYYFLIGLVYEFLSLGVGLVAVGYYALRRRTPFHVFLAFWAVLSFLAYTIAGEKMPWLLASVALPFLVLTGKLLGDALEAMPWRRALRRWAWTALPLAALATLAAARALWLFLHPPVTVQFGWTVAAAALLVAALAAVAMLRRQERAVALAGLGLVAVLLGMSVFTALRAAYDSYDDDPIEMAVYAQGSISIARNVEELREYAAATGDGLAVPVLIDDEIAWPQVWHFREFTSVTYQCLKEPGAPGATSFCRRLEAPLEHKVLWVTSARASRDAAALEGYRRTGPWRSTIWFPEGYRNLTPRVLWEGLRTREGWRGPVDYWVARRLRADWLASYYYVYYAPLPQG